MVMPAMVVGDGIGKISQAIILAPAETILGEVTLEAAIVAVAANSCTTIRLEQTIKSCVWSCKRYQPLSRNVRLLHLAKATGLVKRLRYC